VNDDDDYTAEKIANHIIALEERAEKAEAEVVRLKGRADAHTKEGAQKLIFASGTGRLAMNEAMALVRVDELTETVAAAVAEAFREGRFCTCAVRLGAQRPHADTCGSLAKL
jgi:hypothetical protein